MTDTTVNHGGRALPDKETGYNLSTVPVRQDCQAGSSSPDTTLGIPARQTIPENRLRTYELSVDGKGPGVGLCQVTIAGLLDIKKQSVSEHQAQLVQEEYLEKINEERPTFYKRGKKAKMLDHAILEWRSGNYEESVDGRYYLLSEFAVKKRKEKGTVQPALSRCHLDGKIIFPVLHKGDMTALRIRSADGCQEIAIFEKEPYMSHNNVERWKGWVPFYGEKIRVEYSETPNLKTLKIWPSPVYLKPEEMGREAIINKAREVIRPLLIYGGWSFGAPSLVGKVDDATTDKRILSQIPDGVQPPSDSGLKIDRSTGPRELETVQESDRERARAIFDFPNFTAKTERRLDMLEENDRVHFQKLLLLRDRASLLEETMEKIVRVEERHTELLIREREQNLRGDRILTNGSGMYQ